MHLLRLLTVVSCSLMVASRPSRRPTEEDVFFHSLDASEQEELLQRAVEQVLKERKRGPDGSYYLEVQIDVPARLDRRARDATSTDAEFFHKLVQWVGRQWKMSDKATADLVTTGRGCSDGKCLQFIANLNQNCCPFGK